MRGRMRKSGPKKRRRAARPRDRGYCHALTFRGFVLHLVALFFSLPLVTSPPQSIASTTRSLRGWSS